MAEPPCAVTRRIASLSFVAGVASPVAPAWVEGARSRSGGSLRRLSLAPFPRQRCSPWSPRASVERAPGVAAALTVEPSRVGGPPARLGQPRPMERAPGAAAALTVEPSRVRRPARSARVAPACGVRARTAAALTVPLSRSAAGQVASDTAGRNSAAARRYVAREAGTRRVSTRQRRGRPSPAGCVGTRDRRHSADPPLPGGSPLTCSPPHMKG
jgi:hypothetical protein